MQSIEQSFSIPTIVTSFGSKKIKNVGFLPEVWQVDNGRWLHEWRIDQVGRWTCEFTLRFLPDLTVQTYRSLLTNSVFWDTIEGPVWYLVFWHTSLVFWEVCAYLCQNTKSSSGVFVSLFFQQPVGIWWRLGAPGGADFGQNSGQRCALAGKIMPGKLWKTDMEDLFDIPSGYD